MSRITTLESMKKALVALVLALSAMHLSSYAASPPKPGAPCSKFGQTKVHKSKKFTCLKIRKKLVWNQGFQRAEPAPVVTESAAPVVSPTPSATPSVKRTELDQVDIRGSIVYGIKDGLLTRLASDRYFESDSRTEKEFPR